MLIDLHCHTLPLSQCSALRPEEMVDAARERRLDGICLTEHDATWDEHLAADLRQRTGFVVLRGVELTTDLGHVLAYGFSQIPPSFASGRSVAEAAAEQGAVLFLAHPARDGLLRVTRETVDTFASVEAINGSDSRLQNMAATGLAHGFPLPGIGGSDAHTLAEVGRAATRFERDVRTEAELLEELRAGRYEAVALD